MRNEEKGLNINNNSSYLITNLTHVQDTYILNLLESYPKMTFLQSFILAFFSLLGDETFILLILLRFQFPKSKILFSSFLVSILFLNTINVLIGRALDLLLYQNFIDLFAVIIYGFIGLRHFFKFWDKKNRLTYIKEIKMIIKPNMILMEEEEDDQTNPHLPTIIDSDNNNEEEENDLFLNQDYIYTKYYEGHNKAYLFWIFGKTIFISIFWDSYMLAIISNSAISNFKGTIYGSSLAIFIIVYLSCYHGMYIGNYLSEGKMGVIISFIYMFLASEIFFIKTF